MPPNFDGQPNIVELGKRRKNILQVVLRDFILTKNDTGTTLDVCINSDLLSIVSNAGKREFFDRLGSKVKEEREKLRKKLVWFYRNKDIVAYHFDCSSCPIRYANGGVLPVVRLDSEDYFCLFYRGIFPIGWNIANGGSDDLDELLDPSRIVYREFGEELMVSNHQKRLIYMYEPGKEDKNFGLTNEALEAWKLRFNDRNFAKYDRLSLPIKWIEGPDKVSAKVGRRSHTSGGHFVNINPEDNSIEVDRIALIKLKDDISLFDGEISRGVLVNRAIGLFRVSEFRREIRTGKIKGGDFRPTRLFIGGEERKTSDLEDTLRRECMLATASILQDGDLKAFDKEPLKLNLCPVTRGIIERYFQWEQHEGRRSLLTTQQEQRVDAGIKKCEVFISFNSPDLLDAQRLHKYLTDRGHSVFCSAETLAQLGASDYAAAIHDALDSASCLVVLATRRQHLDSGWVDFEWKSFFNEIHSRRKTNAHLFTFLSGVSVEELPFALRQVERIEYSPSSTEESFEKLYRYLERSLRPRSERARA